MSSLGVGNGYQAFGINVLRRGLGINDKMMVDIGSRSGNFGFAMSEKDSTKGCVYLFFFDIWFSVVNIDPLMECFRKFWGADLESGGGRSCQGSGGGGSERERERAEREKEESEVAHTMDPTQSGSKSPERSIPSGVLTPLLKRHRELDDELEHRLQELEQK
jgi:kinesin family protein 22